MSASHHAPRADAATSADVLITDELTRRPARPPDYAAENRALLELASAMTASPDILDALAQSAAQLCGVPAAGISLLEGEPPARRFRCRAAVGVAAPLLGQTAAVGDSPSTITVEHNAPQLLSRPGRRYPHIDQFGTAGEMLLVPLCRGAEPIGTLWVLARPGERRFDSEDARLLSSLAYLAAAAIQLHTTSEAATRAAAELRDLQARLERTLAASAIATWVWDIPHRRVFADGNLRRLFGLAGEQPHGIPLEQFDAAIHPDDRAAVQTAVRRALHDGQALEIEYRVHNDAGALRWVVARGQVERDAAGTPRRLPGAVVDITARKLAEERAQRLATETAVANATFRAVLEQSPFYAGVLSPDGRLVEGSRSAFEPCGYRRDAEMHRLFWDTGWWHGSRAVQDEIRGAVALVAAGETYRAQLPYFFADGTERMCELLVTPLTDDGGHVMSLLAIGIDITDRLLSEQALRHSELRLEAELSAMTRLQTFSTRLLAAADQQAVLDEILTAAMGLLSADKGSVQLYNPASGTLEIAAQLGFAPSFLDFFRTVRLDDDSAGARAAKTRRRMVIADVEREARYAPLREVAAAAGYRAVQSTPLLTRGGELLGLLSTHFRLPHTPSDMELRVLDLYVRQAADVLERARFQATLAEADRRKTEFLATLAHELRNPLAPIANASQILRRAGDDPALAEASRAVIDRQVQHLVRLVDDLLDLSRIATGKLELRQQRCTLAAVIDTAVEASQPIIDAAGHRLHIQLPDETIFLHGDPTRLAQVFLNLLNNAAKYTAGGGDIWLSATRQDDQVTVRVRDSGAGIAAEMLSRIFDLFAQVTDSLGRTHGGLGIGLTLARRLVDMHGGRIEAHSDGPNRGSEFVVVLPVADAAQSQPDAVETTAPAPSAPRRVLVVDDNADAAESMSLLLSLLGHEVRTAYDGEAALVAAEQFRPDLVLLDIGLPGLDGHQVAERLRADPLLRGITLVALTGWAQDDDRRRSREAGFDYHLVKPTELDLQRILSADAPR